MTQDYEAKRMTLGERSWAIYEARSFRCRTRHRSSSRFRKLISIMRKNNETDPALYPFTSRRISLAAAYPVNTADYKFSHSYRDCALIMFRRIIHKLLILLLSPALLRVTVDLLFSRAPSLFRFYSPSDALSLITPITSPDTNEIRQRNRDRS